MHLHFAVICLYELNAPASINIEPNLIRSLDNNANKKLFRQCKVCLTSDTIDVFCLFISGGFNKLQNSHHQVNIIKYVPKVYCKSGKRTIEGVIDEI